MRLGFAGGGGMDYGVGGGSVGWGVCDPLGSARLTANHLAPTQVRPLSPPPPTLYILQPFLSRYPSYGILLPSSSRQGGFYNRSRPGTVIIRPLPRSPLPKGKGSPRSRRGVPLVPPLNGGAGESRRSRGLFPLGCPPRPRSMRTRALGNRTDERGPLTG